MAYSTTTDWAMPKRNWSFVRMIAAMMAARKDRKQKPKVRLISERELKLNDYMLRDIGLTTDDVKDALSKPRRWL